MASADSRQPNIINAPTRGGDRGASVAAANSANRRDTIGNQDVTNATRYYESTIGTNAYRGGYAGSQRAARIASNNAKTQNELSASEGSAYASASKAAAANKNRNNTANNHKGVLSYYMPRFYEEARGHVLNKYHVAFGGPYVKEALRVMDLNSRQDKYDKNHVKTFLAGNTFYKDMFDDWMTLNYDAENGLLNMLWAAKSVTIPGCSAKIENTRIDTTKDMEYPLVSTHESSSKTLSIEVVDDPYMMWWQFFNALFNVQFSPLTLKARSTWHKMDIYVTLYGDAVNTTTAPMVTDITNAEIFEFNSTVLVSAPSTDMAYSTGEPYSFKLEFKYPNAFQGSFKDQFRGLRDNTTSQMGLANDSGILMKGKYEYNTGSLEDDYKTLQSQAPGVGDLYEALRVKDYAKYNFQNKDLAYRP